MAERRHDSRGSRKPKSSAAVAGVEAEQRRQQVLQRRQESHERRRREQQEHGEQRARHAEKALWISKKSVRTPWSPALLPDATSRHLPLQAQGCTRPALGHHRSCWGALTARADADTWCLLVVPHLVGPCSYRRSAGPQTSPPLCPR
jgi:hypothetical protein|eukprot:SAG25_NODE_299_length_10186_cov_64.813621_13_plen_147_part_00